MNNKDTTCGPLFLSALEHFKPLCGGDFIKSFAAGHMTGQAEKIYLGACPAAMFRPTLEYRDWCLACCMYLSSLYGLEVSVFDSPGLEDEVWIHKPSHTGVVGSIQNEAPNSPSWHYLRGLLCGISQSDIDPEFHLRKGYREACIPETDK